MTPGLPLSAFSRACGLGRGGHAGAGRSPWNRRRSGPGPARPGPVLDLRAGMGGCHWATTWAVSWREVEWAQDAGVVWSRLWSIPRRLRHRHAALESLCGWNLQLISRPNRVRLFQTGGTMNEHIRDLNDMLYFAEVVDRGWLYPPAAPSVCQSRASPGASRAGSRWACACCAPPASSRSPRWASSTTGHCVAMRGRAGRRRGHRRGGREPQGWCAWPAW